MRDDVQSLTAIYVAFARALATRDPELSHACSDPYAEALLPRALVPLLHSAKRLPAVSDAVRRLSFGLCDHIALRTALIDAATEHATADHLAPGSDGKRASTAVEQLVLLGAGLDARAHRMPCLAQVTVFEVDHPATQKVKRHKAQHLPVLAREVRYAACDFARTRIEDALSGVGFDATKRSLWIWEGVAMYLPATQVLASLRTIAQLSRPESLLVATYLTPDRVAGGALLGRWSTQFLGAIAEPIRFTREPDELAALFEHAGFEVWSDASPNDAAPHFGVHVKRPTSLMPTERIAVAVKTGVQT